MLKIYVKKRQHFFFSLGEKLKISNTVSCPIYHEDGASLIFSASFSSLFFLATNSYSRFNSTLNAFTYSSSASSLKFARNKRAIRLNFLCKNIRIIPSESESPKERLNPSDSTSSLPSLPWILRDLFWLESESSSSLSSD